MSRFFKALKLFKILHTFKTNYLKFYISSLKKGGEYIESSSSMFKSHNSEAAFHQPAPVGTAV